MSPSLSTFLHLLFCPGLPETEGVGPEELLLVVRSQALLDSRASMGQDSECDRCPYPVYSASR